MITFDEYGARFDGEGTLILKTHHLAELTKKDTEIIAMEAELSDAWALAFNLWPGVKKEPSELDLCGVIHELSERYLAEIAALTKEIEIKDGSWRVAANKIEAIVTLQAQLAKPLAALSKAFIYETLLIEQREVRALLERVRELEAAQDKIIGMCESCGVEGLAEIERLENRIKELESDLSTNATLLARQCDLARDAERQVLAAERKIKELEAIVNHGAGEGNKILDGYSNSLEERDARIRELEAERDGFRNGQLQMQASSDALFRSNNKLGARIRELEAEHINKPPEERTHCNGCSLLERASRNWKRE